MSIKSKIHFLSAGLWLSLLCFAMIVPQPTSGRQSKLNPAETFAAAANAVSLHQDSLETARRVKQIFTDRCFQCHGKNGRAARNIFTQDRTGLVSSRVVIPGDVSSPLFKAIESGAMPSGGPALSADEKAVIREWILAGAPDWGSNSSRARPEFISESAILSKIAEDLERTPPRDRQYIRYFSLAHLRNAGVPEEELEGHRLAITKLINSLSWHREITTPTLIDAARTLLRIDLRDYLWTAAAWRRILSIYPYGLILPESERVARLSGEAVAYMRGDWFVNVASAPPLYHELLELPHSIVELERRLGVDSARNLTEEKNVIRAGIRSSGVSQNNRAVERHVSSFGAYWRSYDFRSNLGDQNLFANPLRLNAAGGEIIFNLPNGLQAYFLADGQGRRIDTAPVEIVADRNQPDDPLIRNGRSCMACHFAGVKSFRDDVRPSIQRTAATSEDLDHTLALYVSQEAIDRATSEDELRFFRAEERLGGKYRDRRWDTSAHSEPVNALSRRYQSELPLDLAAAEVGLESADFGQRLRWNTRLNNLGFGQLLAQGGAVKRDVWEKHFGEIARELQIGQHLRGSQLAVRWNSNQAISNPVAGVGPNRQPAPLRGQLAAHVVSTQNELNDLLRAVRTIFIMSDSVYIRPELLETALRGRADFQPLNIAIVKDRDSADLIISLNRPLFTFDFTYSVTHRQSSRLVTAGKVSAFDGNGAASKIAKELVTQMKSAR
jgi:hypothetical protein